jgi:hypothetical protein
MRLVTIDLSGKTLADVGKQIDAAKEKILQGFYSGASGDNDGCYLFFAHDEDDSPLSDYADDERNIVGRMNLSPAEHT